MTCELFSTNNLTLEACNQEEEEELLIIIVLLPRYYPKRTIQRMFEGNG